MKKRLLPIILPVITLILEILPCGAVCNFGNPEGEPWRETFSYFDLTPFGYANFAPFLTAILTCVILPVNILFFITGKQTISKITQIVLIAACILSLCPLLLGIRFFSFVGILITLSLIAELILYEIIIHER